MSGYEIATKLDEIINAMHNGETFKLRIHKNIVLTFFRYTVSKRPTFHVSEDYVEEHHNYVFHKYVFRLFDCVCESVRVCDIFNQILLKREEQKPFYIFYDVDDLKVIEYSYMNTLRDDMEVLLDDFNFLIRD